MKFIDSTNLSHFWTKVKDYLSKNYLTRTDIIAGNNITVTKNDINNTVTINSTASGSGSDEKVKMSSTSTTANYLDQLIDGITIKVENDKLVASGKGNFSEMNDVNIITPVAEQVICYDSVSGKYINRNTEDTLTFATSAEIDTAFSTVFS